MSCAPHAQVLRSHAPGEASRGGGGGGASAIPAALRERLPEPAPADPLDPGSLAAHLAVHELAAPSSRPPG